MSRLLIEEAGRGPLSRIGLRLGPGEVGWLQGPSGSGKTLILYLAAGLLHPDTGRARVDGSPPGPGRVAMLFQNPDYQLVASRVAEDVEQGGRAREVEAALTATGCQDFRDRSLEELSPGQRRRVALAGVLAACPPVALLDTPFAGMGRAEASRLCSGARAFLVERDCTVLATGEPPEESPGDTIWDVTQWRAAGPGPAPGDP